MTAVLPPSLTPSSAVMCIELKSHATIDESKSMRAAVALAFNTCVH